MGNDEEGPAFLALQDLERDEESPKPCDPLPSLSITCSPLEEKVHGEQEDGIHETAWLPQVACKGVP